MDDTHPSVFEFSKTFALFEQDRFAALSGDFNPIHLDTVAARRTLFGETVVHGMHLVLVVFEEMALRIIAPGTSNSVVSLRVNFPRPCTPGDLVKFSGLIAEGEHYHISGFVGTDQVLDMHLSMELTVERFPRFLPRAHLFEVNATSLDFDELEHLSGTIALALPMEEMQKFFPESLKAFGPHVISDLLALTRLVGMRCPGLHSLFGGFDVQGTPNSEASQLEFEVTAVDDRFSLVRIRIEGSALKGNLRTFVRPAEIKQNSTAAVASRVRSNLFERSVSLIVGGTRGLGEISAKIIAAGGGKVILTYNQGLKDAQRVSREIQELGFSCEILQLDVSDCDEAVEKLFSKDNPPTSVYYFASPKIFVRRRKFFDSALLEKFTRYYVGYFSNLLNVAARASTKQLKVFSPSSVAVEAEVRELIEYSIAKRAAEDVCRHYNQHSKAIHITSERLPRVRTDQTATIVPFPAEDPFEIMYPIVERIENASLNIPSSETDKPSRPT